MDNDQQQQRRIIVIDDNEDIHRDFHTVLSNQVDSSELDDLEADLFESDEGSAQKPTGLNYELDYASQGKEGVEKITTAFNKGNPYNLAFVDMRMPPGWDGLETVEHMWKVDPSIQVVICTAYSDHSWEEISIRLGNTDNLLILKKPFDSTEVLQLASALTGKWLLAKQAAAKMAELEEMVHQRTHSLRDSEQRIREHNQSLEQVITERTEDLLQAKETAELANLEKTEFLANMSHELRTPMHSILSFANLGTQKTDEAPREKLKSYFGNIGDSGKRLLDLLNDLLVLSKLETGNINLQIEAHSLYEVASAQVQQFQELLQERNQKVEVTDPDIDTTTWFDKQKVAQVIRNLLTNAVKFSNKGSKITISFIAHEMPTTASGTATPGVAVQVRDSGIGIPKAELSNVFNKFAQSSKTKDGTSGMGLGLAICREILDAHQGIIWAENNPDGGTIVSFALPSQRSVTNTANQG